MRRIPDPISRLTVSEEAAHRLGGAVPSPAAAFLLAVIALPSLFWLITLKRTTVYTAPEEWLMTSVVPSIHAWVQTTVPPLDTLLILVSALGSGWFVGLGFAVAGLVALAYGRRDLALLVALGTLAFPIEWALKYFTSIDQLSLGELVGAIFNVNNIGLDDIADFPAGHALRATALYGLVAFSVARLAHDRRQGMIAYGVALVLIGAISLVRIYLGAHYPMDLVGGWMAGAALVAILVAIHVLHVGEVAEPVAEPAPLARGRRLSPRRGPARGGAALPAAAQREDQALLDFIDEAVIPFVLDLYDAVGYVGVAIAVALETIVAPIPSEVILPMAGWKVSESAANPAIVEPLTGQPWNLPLAIALATVGSLVGAIVGYYIGAWGGRPLLDRYGRYVGIGAEDLDRADRWFDRWGSWAVFLGRMVPLVRTFVSYPAGISRMPMGRFILFSTLGSLPWNAGLIGAGFLVGENYAAIEATLKPYEYVIYAVVVLVVLVLVARWLIGKRRAAATG